MVVQPRAATCAVQAASGAAGPQPAFVPCFSSHSADEGCSGPSSPATARRECAVETAESQAERKRKRRAEKRRARKAAKRAATQAVGGPAPRQQPVTASAAQEATPALSSSTMAASTSQPPGLAARGKKRNRQQKEVPRSPTAQNEQPQKEQPPSLTAHGKKRKRTAQTGEQHAAEQAQNAPARAAKAGFSAQHGRAQARDAPAEQSPGTPAKAGFSAQHGQAAQARDAPGAVKNRFAAQRRQLLQRKGPAAALGTNLGWHGIEAPPPPEPVRPAQSTSPEQATGDRRDAAAVAAPEAVEPTLLAAAPAAVEHTLLAAAPAATDSRKIGAAGWGHSAAGGQNGTTGSKKSARGRTDVALRGSGNTAQAAAAAGSARARATAAGGAPAAAAVAAAGSRNGAGAPQHGASPGNRTLTPNPWQSNRRQFTQAPLLLGKPLLNNVLSLERAQLRKTLECLAY